MSTRNEKSEAVRFLEDLVGGPLTIGKLIESIRLGEELTQAAFAKRLGITRSSLNDIEKGRKLVSPERAARWAKLLERSEQSWVQIAIEDQLARSGLRYSVKLEPKRKRAA